MKEIVFESIDSTNTYLKEHYAETEDQTFVRSEEQTAGRGRHTRVWESRKGENLLFSLLLKDRRVFPYFKELSLISALSVAQLLQKYGLESVGIKWPNDVYVRDAKICGILLESVSQETMECLIIGIGLNVNQKTFPNTFLHEATSMKNELGKEISLEKVKEDLYRILLNNIQKVTEGYDFQKEISAMDYLKGKEAVAQICKEERKVKVTGIQKDGSLKVDLNGETLCLYSGEISFHKG